VKLEEVQALTKLDSAGSRERGAPVASIGFVDEEGTNVATAFDDEGVPLFNFGWRPFLAGEHGYDPDGLFFC